MSSAPNRSELLRRGRIALLDDAAPEMLADLQRHGLAIDHLPSTDDPRFGKLEEGFYDLLLLDYGGVGARFGPDEGLDVLRHLSRVSPALRILAFTSLTFDASKADFFRNVSEVVRKDAGIASTLETIERHLGQVLTPAFQFESLIKVLDLQPVDARVRKVEKLIAKSVGATNALSEVKEGCAALGLELITRAGEAAVVKCIELMAIGT